MSGLRQPSLARGQVGQERETRYEMTTVHTAARPHNSQAHRVLPLDSVPVRLDLRGSPTATPPRDGGPSPRPAETARLLITYTFGSECSVADCKRQRYTRGWCSLHYQRWRKYGDPLHGFSRGNPRPGGPSELGRQLGVTRSRAHQLLHPVAHKARTLVKNALKAGRLKRPDCCSRCGLQARRIQAHHDDYGQPLEIRWLCSKCHALEHPHHPYVHEERWIPGVGMAVSS